jgi:hypothetical protein
LFGIPNEKLNLIATTSKTGGMRKALKRGHIEQSLVFIDRINPSKMVFALEK